MTVAEDRTRIYSRGGIGLCDPRVTVERNWSVNSETEAEFDITITDPNFREDFLRFGNWLLVENNKLDSWVGMIDVPMEWKQFAVHMRAYSPDRLLHYRNVPRNLKLSGTSGAIFTELINIANRAEQTIIEVGDVWQGGPTLPEEELSGDNLQDYLDSMVRRTGCEYSFTPVAYDGKLTIKANWHQRMGVDVMMPLEESYNLALEQGPMKLQGKFYNSMWGYGNGAGTGDRPTAVYIDPESAGIYGIRESSKVYSDFNGAGAVERAVRDEVNQNRYPRRTFKLSVADVGSTWENMRKGNTYPLRLWSVGFGIKTNVRVTGAYYNPLRGKVELVSDEVINDISE